MQSVKTADLEVDRAAHAVESQYTGRVVASTLALDRAVLAGDVLIELDADMQKLQLSEERTKLAALGPQIQSLEAQIAAEERAAAEERQTASVALDEARAHFREADTAAHLAESEGQRLNDMYPGAEWSPRRTGRGPRPMRWSVAQRPIACDLQSTEWGVKGVEMQKTGGHTLKGCEVRQTDCGAWLQRPRYRSRVCKMKSTGVSSVHR